MTELEKIAHARTYIEKLANGINPLTDQPVPEDDVINQVRISRCLFYVSNLMRQMMEQQREPRPKVRTKKVPFQLPHEERANFRFSEVPIPVSEIVNRINDMIDPEQMVKMSYRQISGWLTEIGMLSLSESAGGRPVRRPTVQGAEIGISTEQRQGQNGPYVVILYNRSAQQFVLDNLDAIQEWQQRQKEQRKSISG